MMPFSDISEFAQDKLYDRYSPQLRVAPANQFSQYAEGLLEVINTSYRQLVQILEKRKEDIAHYHIKH